MNLLKCTIRVDASFNPENNLLGIGVMVQSSDDPKKDGPIQSVHSETHYHADQRSKENFAILRGLQIAYGLGYKKVKIRTTFNSWRKNLKEDQKCEKNFEKQSIHGEILRFTKLFEEVKFGYLPTKKNIEVRKLAREGAHLLPKKKKSFDDEPRYFGYSLDQIIEMENRKREEDEFDQPPTFKEPTDKDEVPW